MALDMALQQVGRELSGVYTVSVDMIEDGKRAGGFTAQGNTKEEVKDNLRPKVQAYIDGYNARSALRAKALAAIDELRTELGLPIA